MIWRIIVWSLCDAAGGALWLEDKQHENSWSAASDIRFLCSGDIWLIYIHHIRQQNKHHHHHSPVCRSESRCSFWMLKYCSTVVIPCTVYCVLCAGVDAALQYQAPPGGRGGVRPSPPQQHETKHHQWHHIRSVSQTKSCLFSSFTKSQFTLRGDVTTLLKWIKIPPGHENTAQTVKLWKPEIRL